MSEVKSFEDFIKELYSNPLPEETVLELYDLYKYQGFERQEILKQAFDKLKSPKLVAELIILCAVQSPSKAAHQKLTNGLTPTQMGIPYSGQKGTKNLSCTRLTAATADLAAYYLKKIPNLPRKIADLDLPAWLQFPSAASITLPQKYRKLHREFSEKFSTKINADGKFPFNAEIYEQMEMNSYLDEKLGLFDEE